MTNSIIQEQNTPQQLNRLAASRVLYSRAKLILAIQIVITVPTALLWSIILALYPDLKVYAALWAICITLLDILVLDRLQRSLTKRGASIQELFDCDVLKLEWPGIKIGARPDTETILESAKGFEEKDRSSLRNWYPVSVGELPLALARVVCQRTNSWWDSKMRHRYANSVIIVVVLMIVSVFLLGIINGMTLEKFFLFVLAPLTPTLVFGIREYIRNVEVADKSEQLKRHSETLWERALSKSLSDDQLEKESRKLQDAIYDRRQSSPVIFDWFYYRYRGAYEEQMNKGAEELVSEALRLKVRKVQSSQDSPDENSIN